MDNEGLRLYSIKEKDYNRSFDVESRCLFDKSE